MLVRLVHVTRYMQRCEACIYIGTYMAWRQGIAHLQMESDLKVLVDMVTMKCNIN